MPPITALLHTANDALRLGRALETLFPCSEILVIDHRSSDTTLRVAREYGARIVQADNASNARRYLEMARHDWIFCMSAAEALTEALQASLLEWSLLPAAAVASASAFSVSAREQVGEDWREFPVPETRLVPRSWALWNGRLPGCEPSAVALEGALLRFAYP
jgi:glycosyltransferase involved in cell wall biosynthesis